MSKPAPCSKSGRVKSLECGEDVSKLRQKLSSVGWIQCDKLDCLKWRQVRLSVLQQVTEETPWTCDMNEDDSHNRCSLPEEDTTGYEKLAKRAKLDVITSRLKPGTLVWAKVQGYCRWPALITADPLSGQHTDEDDCEAVAYHVEFLGGKRSHGWIKSKCVEVFGPGKMRLAELCSQVQNGPAMKLQNLTISQGRHKSGSHKLHLAIDEALQLLPLALEARLQTCQFVTALDVSTRSRTENIKKPAKMTSAHNVRKPPAAPEHGIPLAAGSWGLKCSHRQPDVCKQNRSFNQSSTEIRMQATGRAGHNLVPIIHTGSTTEKRRRVTARTGHSMVANRHLPDVGHSLGVCTLSGGCAGSQMRTPDFAVFPSSLMISSKESRFMEDVQVYQQNEQLFEEELAQFHASHGLRPPQVPTWQNVQANQYCLFLAVLDRGGFLRVCDQRQWASVYTEVTDLSCRQGAGLCRQYYQRNLYPFELYICGHGNMTVVQELGTCVEQHASNSSGREAGDSGVDTDDMDEFDSPDIVRHLDELDRILMSLEQGRETHGCIPDKANEVVPMTCALVPEDKDDTDDARCHNSADAQVLHKMQALHHDLDFLQHEIDLL